VFITSAGERIDPGGVVTVGPAAAATGIVSRKSELRDLRRELTRIAATIDTHEAEQARLRHDADALATPIMELAAEIAGLTGAAGTLRERIAEHRQKHARLMDAAELLGQEIVVASADRDRADAVLASATTEARTADAAAAAVTAHLSAAEAATRTAEAMRDQRHEDHTAAQVALCRAKQAAATTRSRVGEIAAELKQRKIDQVNAAAAVRAARSRAMETLLAALRATAATAHAFATKDDRERKVAALVAERDTIQRARDAAAQMADAGRDADHARREAVHARALAVREASAHRQAVAHRIQDEYAVALAELPPPDDDTPAFDVSAAVDELRRKIAKLGSVNLEAVEQLAAEQTREADYRRQFDDLTHAARSLADIIEQINTDSRRLFTETLGVVRGQFQELFRKLFGGGQADIVLEANVDVLDSGIDITARPPGKELRSISLMSGGEKTLTAVALLLAIFRSKPSPFCLLDEVDAALDEANAVRLVGVLQEFKAQSQFIVITHKKRTMAAADVLHGITMQESGVSKRVALRFEDWPDESDTSGQRRAA
jgi:chromosome segregation protein